MSETRKPVIMPGTSPDSGREASRNSEQGKAEEVMKPLLVNSKWINVALGKNGWLIAWRLMRNIHIKEEELWVCDCDACTRTQKRRVNGYG